MTRALIAAICSLTVAACGGGGSDAPGPLVATWSFSSGDCASNGVETVQITWGKEGAEQSNVDYACADGSGELGELDEGGGTYTIAAEGVDADGAVRAETFGQSITFGDPAPPEPTVDITLHPAAANVVVNWSHAAGGNCPGQVILPYHITVYEPATDGTLGSQVATVQESCSSGTATVPGVPPGDYIVELDSRAVTPAVYATEMVTVEAGADATVDLEL